MSGLKKVVWTREREGGGGKNHHHESRPKEDSVKIKILNMEVDLSQTQRDKTKLLIMEVDLNKTQRDKAKKKIFKSSS